MELENSPEDSITVAIRFKGTSDTLDRVMEIDLQQDGFRERLYIYTDNTYKLQEANVSGDLPGSVMDWHIYRLTKTGDSVNFYFDENPAALETMKTPTSTSENYFRFGDGNGSSTLGGIVDWVIWDTTGAYAPLAGAAIPDTLVSKVPLWKVYAANQVPLSSDPAFVASNTSGSADTNTFNTIMEDPDIPGNNLLEEITNVSDARYMFRYTFPENPTAELTIVGRFRGISGEYDRVMEIDMDHGGFRERLYVNTDSSFRLQEAGLIDTLDAGVLGWHLYRLTKTGDSVNFYLDENPEPVATVKTPTVSATNNYFRFGDGNSSITLGAYVDWIIWDESGAYAPGRGNYIPDSLVISVSSADLSNLTLSAGTLDPDFHADTLEYDVVLPGGTETVTVDAAGLDASSTITGTGDVDVSSGSGIATLVVTASDMVTTKTYTVNFTVTHSPSNDATLSSLTVSAGTLEPAFDANTTEYALTVPSGTTAVTITVTTTDANATVAGDGEIAVLPGTATLVITAEDGSTQKTYTVDITIQTSIQDRADDRMQLYPVPFGDRLVFNSASVIREITVYNMAGKMVMMRTVNSRNHELVTSDLKAGVYFIKIITAEEVFIKKAAKN